MGRNWYFFKVYPLLELELRCCGGSWEPLRSAVCFQSVSRRVWGCCWRSSCQRECSSRASHPVIIFTCFLSLQLSPPPRTYDASSSSFLFLSVHFQARTALISISPSPLLSPVVFAKWRVINGDSLVGAAVCSPLCLLFVSAQENQNCRRRGARLPTDYSDCLDVS